MHIPRWIALITLFSVLTANAAAPLQSIESALESTQLDPVVEAGMLQYKAVQLVTSTAAIEDFEKNIGIIFDRMSELSLSARDPLVARKAAKIAVKSMKLLGFEGRASQIVKDFLRYQTPVCTQLYDCLSLLGDFSELLPHAPREVIKYLYQAVSTSSEKSHGSWGPVSQRIIDFRMEALEYYADFYEATQISAEYKKGVHLQLLPTELDRLRKRGERAHRLMSDLSQQQVALAKELGKGDGVQEVAAAIIDGLYPTGIGVTALDLYLNRVNQVDITAFIQDVTAKALQNDETLTAALVMGVIFSGAESYLPWRKDWAHMVETLSLRAKNLIGESAKDLSESVSEQVRIREATLQEFLKAQDFDKNRADYGYRETIAQRLTAGEKHLAVTYFGFHSLYHQSRILDSSQAVLAKAAEAHQENIKKDPSHSAHERFEDSLRGNYSLAAADWMSLACYGVFSPGLDRIVNRSATSELTVPYTFFAKAPFLEENKFNVGYLCRKELATDPEVLKNGIQGPVFDYLRKKMVGDIYFPFIVEQSIHLVSLPIMYASAGTSNAVTRVAAPVVTRAIVGAALRVAVNKMAVRSLYRISMRLSTAIIGSAIFTATQRTLTSAVTFGRIPLYDEKKSFFGNYGNELVHGSLVFLFLPYSGQWVGKAYRKVSANPHFMKLSMQQQIAIKAGMSLGANTTIFTAMPYIQRATDRVIHGKKEEILRGPVDFAQNVGRAMTAAMVFSLAEVHAEMQTHRLVSQALGR